MSRAAQSGAPLWFIEAAGRVWGPYPEARLANFVAEGRVARETLVGSRPEGPFGPAVRQARLRGLFGEAGPGGFDLDEAPEPAQPTRLQPRPHPAREIAPEPRASRPAHTASQLDTGRPLLVWTSLTGSRADRFEDVLDTVGPFARVRSGLWLVRSPMGPAALRNALTRRMQAGNSLMVIHAALNQAAWFNLDGETDRSLRQLWMD